jgi:hypothetical protein
MLGASARTRGCGSLVSLRPALEILDSVLLLPEILPCENTWLTYISLSLRQILTGSLSREHTWFA